MLTKFCKLNELLVEHTRVEEEVVDTRAERAKNFFETTPSRASDNAYLECRTNVYD